MEDQLEEISFFFHIAHDVVSECIFNILPNQDSFVVFFMIKKNNAEI